MCDELRKDPSIPQLAAAVTLYHVVIEATLAQPGQHFITSYLTDRDLLPGFREGMENVAADEQRHIGFGVKLLSDLREMDPEVPDAVAELLREVIPWTASVLIPPGLGHALHRVLRLHAARTSARRGPSRSRPRCARPACRSTSCPARPSSPSPGTPRERAERGHKMVRAGYLGEKVGPPSTDPADMRLLFETVAGGLDAGAAAEPGDDPVGVPRRRALARGGRERRHARRARPRRPSRA